ncbi:MAG: T9SS type A sorting domain-containing protein [Flavobacteriia bacterium]|nr:T9SS type A sorting domain-containing protein [Flavobacteriia bacterium]
MTFLIFGISQFVYSQTVLYTENMDNGSGGVNADFISVHESNDRFEQVGLTYSGTGDLRNTLPSSGYTSASGGFNVLFNNIGEYLMIDGLDLSSCLSDVVVSFGVLKSTSSSDGSGFILQYSTSGPAGTFYTVSTPLLPTGTGTAGVWNYISSASNQIPSDATTLRFSCGESTSFRIDDILIECNTTTCIPPGLTLQPTDVLRCEEQNVRFVTAATGTTLNYQWQVDMGAGFVDLIEDATYVGVNNDTLRVLNISAPLDGYLFRCVVSNPCGTENTNSALLDVEVVPTPTITATGPTEFCLGGSVVLTSSSSTNNQWNDGAQSTTQMIVVNQSGSYEVKVTFGQCYKTSAPIEVDAQDPSFALGEIIQPTLCGTPDGSIELLGGAEGTISYRTYTAPLQGPFTQSVSLPYVLNGLLKGQWEITITTSVGCQMKDSVTLDANLPSPTVSPSYQLLSNEYRAEFCQPDSILLTSSSLTGNTWQSFSNGVWTDLATTRSIVVNSTDTLRVEVISGVCTEYSDTVFIKVNRQPIISVQSFLDPSNCGLLDGVVTILGDTIGTLNWIGTASGSNPATDLDTPPNTFDVTGLGAGLYKFVLTDGTCVSDTVSQTLSDPGAPATPVVIAAGSTDFCDGDNVDLSFVPDADPLVNYSWFNGTTDLMNSTPNQVADGNGSFFVVAEKAGCTSISNVIEINEYPYPLIPIITSSDDNDTICTGTSISLTSTITTGSYLWTPNNETTQSISVNVGDDYTVTVTENGCSSTSPIYTITETDTTSLIIGNVSKTTLCGIADATLQVLDIKDSDENTDSLSWSGPVVNQVDNISLPYLISSLSAGNFNLTFTTLGGCVALANVNVLDSIIVPSISLYTDDTVTFCQGNDVTMISSSDLGNQWYYNGNPITGATSNVFTTDSSGVYAVYVTIGSCTLNSTDTIVTAIPLPVLSHDTIIGASLCGFQDAMVAITGVGSGNLSWTGTLVGDSLNLTFGDSIVIDSLFAGTYQFTFDNGTCVSLPYSVTINDTLPAIPTITASGPTTFCADNGVNNVTLSSSSTTGSYLWSNNETTQDITVNLSSNYFVTVTVGNCSVSSDVVNVSVINNPTPPSIVANGDIEFCEGGSVSLTASTANEILWSTSETTQSITISDDASITATVTENGCISNPSNTIDVVVNDVPSITLGSVDYPTTCGGNGTIEINGSGTGNVVWSGQESGTLSSATLPATITNIESGNYTIYFFDGLCASNSLDTFLVDPALPAIPTITSSDADNTICADESVTLTSSATSGTYTWNGTPGSNQSVNVNSSGTYSVTITENNCSSTSEDVYITVNPIPATPSINAQGPTSFCQGGSVNLEIDQNQGITWNPTGEFTQTISVNSSDTYSAYVIIDGCQSATSNSITITVNPIPPVPTITSNGGNSFCEGESITLTSSATSGNNWSNGSQNQTITVSSSGTFFVTVISNGCDNTSNNFVVTRKNQPGALLPAYNDICDTSDVFTFNQGVATDIELGSPFTTTYTVDGTIATDFDPSVGVGTYDVVFTVNEDGCIATAEQSITVIHCEPINGLDEQSSVQYTIYPNPTNGYFSIKGDDLKSIKNIEIFDNSSRSVLKNDHLELNKYIDVNSLSNGIYSVLITSDYGLNTYRLEILK